MVIPVILDAVPPAPPVAEFVESPPLAVTVLPPKLAEDTLPGAVVGAPAAPPVPTTTVIELPPIEPVNVPLE